MGYKIDSDLQAALHLLDENKKIPTAFKLINRSAINGTTKGKSYFEIGQILREGTGGLKADPEVAKLYYDIAVKHFKSEPCDSMDYRELGDYYYFGLGHEAIDKNLALEYYDKAASDGDELAAERAAEIRGQASKGGAETAPTLTPETEAKEEVPPQQKEEVATEAKAAPVVVSPVVTDENKPTEISDKIIEEEIDTDQIFIKAIRILDSASSTQQEKLDAVELCKIAGENGSIRACVLVGYLYEGDNSLVKCDYLEAKKWYELAIEHGSCSAEFRLGILYTNPEVPYADLDKGHDLIVSSAHNGYSFALAYLGDCFRAKVDDVRHLDVAYRYYALAGERGLGSAYHSMAQIDASRQQLDLAAKHDKLALDNGYDPALGYQDPLFYSLHI